MNLTIQIKIVWLLKICLFLGLLLFAQVTVIANNTPDISYVEVANFPPEQRVIPEDSSFKPFAGRIEVESPNMEKAYWLKLGILENYVYSDDGLFAVNPITLNDVAMYIPALSDQALMSHNRFAVKKNSAYTERSSIFEIPKGYQANYDIYFYVQSATSQNFNIEYMLKNQYASIDNLHAKMYYMIFGSLVILAILNLFIYFASNNKSYLYYVFYLSAFLYLIFLTTGELYQFDFASFTANTYGKNLVAYYVLVIAALLFTKNFLQLENLSITLNKFTNVFIWIFILVIVYCLFSSYVSQSLVRIINLLIMCVMLLMLAASVKSIFLGNPRANYFLLAFIPLILMFALRIMASSGIIPANRFTINGYQVAIIFQALILSLGLTYDIYASLRKNQQGFSDISATNMLNIEREYTSFINRFSDTLNSENYRAHYDLVAESFFARLKRVYGALDGAIIYDFKVGRRVLTGEKKSDLSQNYLKFVNDNEGLLKKFCLDNEVVNLSKLMNLDDRQKNLFLIPIHVPMMSFSGLLITFPHYKLVSNSNFNDIHRFATELIRSFVHLFQVANTEKTDQLTKVFSRMGILDVINEIQLESPKLTTLLFNIDNFSQINREFGYYSGDSCLLYLAYLLRKYMPKNVKIGRISSASFLLVFQKHEFIQIKQYVKTIYDNLSELRLERGICQLDLHYSIVESISPHDLAESLLGSTEQTLKPYDMYES